MSAFRRERAGESSAFKQKLQGEPERLQQKILRRHSLKCQRAIHVSER
jgi:hypothetical protein